MIQKYVLTGAPGSGKSSILLELERRGEYIVREAAEDVIKLEQAEGIEKPWELPDFQRKILHLQVQREERIPRDIKRVFIDRGILDGLAYTETGSEINREIQREARAYRGVFLIENLGKTERTEIRREDYTTALELEKKLAYIYGEVAGYKIRRISPAPVEERAGKILNMIRRNAPFRRRYR